MENYEEDNDSNQIGSIVSSFINDPNWIEIFKEHFPEGTSQKISLIFSVLKSLFSQQLFHKPFEWQEIIEWTTTDNTDNQSSLTYKLKSMTYDTFKIIYAFINTASDIKLKKSPEFYERFVNSFFPQFISNIPEDLPSEPLFQFLELLSIAVSLVKDSRDIKYSPKKKDTATLRRQRSKQANPNAAQTTRKISTSERAKSNTDFEVEVEKEGLGNDDAFKSPQPQSHNRKLENSKSNLLNNLPEHNEEDENENKKNEDTGVVMDSNGDH